MRVRVNMISLYVCGKYRGRVEPWALKIHHHDFRVGAVNIAGRHDTNGEVIKNLERGGWLKP